MKLKFFAMLPLGMSLLWGSVAEGAVQAEDDAYEVSGLFAEENDQESIDIDHKKKDKKIKRSKEDKAAEKAEKRRLKEERKSGKAENLDEEMGAESADAKPSKRQRVKNWFNRKFHRNQNTDESKGDKKSQSEKNVKKSKDKSNDSKSKNDTKKPGLMARLKNRFSRNKTSDKK